MKDTVELVVKCSNCRTDNMIIAAATGTIIERELVKCSHCGNPLGSLGDLLSKRPPNSTDRPAKAGPT